MLYGILQMLVNTLTALLGGALLLRFWMQVVRVRPPSPVASFLFQLTDWCVRPLRKIVPGTGGYDWASIVGAVIMALLNALFDAWIYQVFSIRIMALLTILCLVTWVIYGFLGLLILQVIFSWVNPNAPLAPFVSALTEPLLYPIRRIIPSIGGLDLSVLVAFLLLQISLRIITNFIISGMV